MVVLWIPLLVLTGTPDGGSADAGMPAVPAEWAAVKTAAKGPATAFGGYSAGCLQGAASLPHAGPGFELLHLGRHRGFGHPDLVAYIQRLGAALKKKKLGMLLVGDMAQVRGGPTPTGHKSHQTGLDADLGYAFPDWALRRHPTAAERETVMPPAVMDLATGRLNERWGPRVAGVLEVAASDPVVDRIFVNPVIKRELCTRAGPHPPAWLRKLRPWWGHHDHFHVRLRCPAGNDQCQAQEPLPADDGCGKLAWWFSEDAKKTQQKKAAEQAAGPPLLPARCREVLDSGR